MMRYGYECLLDDLVDEQLLQDVVIYQVLLLHGTKDPYIEQGLFLHPLETTEGWNTDTFDEHMGFDLDESLLSIDEPMIDLERAFSPATLVGEDKDAVSDLDDWMNGINDCGHFFGGSTETVLRKDRHTARRVRLLCIEHRLGTDPCEVFVTLSESRETGL